MIYAREFRHLCRDLDFALGALAAAIVALLAGQALAHFLAHPGRSFTREELLSGAGGFDYEGSARTVDNFVRQLRLKFEPDAEEPRHFLTVRGLGYCLEKIPG